MSTKSFFSLPKQEREKVRNMISEVLSNTNRHLMKDIVDSLPLTAEQRIWATDHLTLGILEDDE